MKLITSNSDLQSYCREFSRSEFVAVDTEFIREKTYWPQLCLIQLANLDSMVAVDTIENNLDLSPLLDLMANDKVVKVFHSARQDLEIFYKLMGKLPEPIFDTQIAAMVCGFGDSVGYATLVQQLLCKSIDKSARYTDWSRRPLTQRQLNYALADVDHLRALYREITEKLETSGRELWLQEELNNLTDETNYLISPKLAWHKLKSRSQNPRHIAILIEIARWRENEAQKRDLPRGHILRDDVLIEIANSRPKSSEALLGIRGLGKKWAKGSAGASLLQAVEIGLNTPESSIPNPTIEKPLPRNIGPTSELLKVLLKMKCKEHDVAQKLIATSSDIEKIAAFGDKADVLALQGWRREIYGEDALRLRSGELSMTIKKGKIVLV